MSRMKALRQAAGEDAVKRAVMRNVVGLCCRLKKPGMAEPRYYHASGFILAINASWYFVTAAHVLKDLEAFKAAGGTVDQWHLDESIDWLQPARAIPAPFTFGPNDVFRYVSDNGDDYALVQINPFHRRELEANRKAALTEDQRLPALADCPPRDFQAFCIVGAPSDLVKASYTQDARSVSKEIVICEVTPVSESAVPPEHRRAAPSFYGYIPVNHADDGLESSLKTIKGMSGGPILALQIAAGGAVESTVIALQSAWYPRIGLVIGCPIAGFPEWFTVQRESARPYALSARPGGV